MDSAEFRRGITLINQGHFFEAHEVLEDLWRPMSLADRNRLTMQGLVQIAVALHHHSTSNWTGALSVMRRAARNLAPAKQDSFGCRLDLLRPKLDAWIAALEAHQSPAPLQIVIEPAARP